MKTQTRRKPETSILIKDRSTKSKMSTILLALTFIFISISGYAHCDSYDGPVIKDALKALDKNNVQLVLKWIEPQQEKEIIALFNKTYGLKNRDQQVYSMVEKHFLETLVRLHRETEGEPYTGLKPAGSMTPLIALGDSSIAKNDVDKVITTVTTKLEQALRERYEEVAKLNKTKDDSVELGRAYVAAYVQYTHLLEKLELLLHGPISHEAGH